jgi:hypothetical protein
MRHTEQDALAQFRACAWLDTLPRRRTSPSLPVQQDERSRGTRAKRNKTVPESALTSYAL